MISWRNVTIALSKLKPWEHNPRTMTKAQAKRLLKSWDALGQFQTIAIGPIEPDGSAALYDGHQRYMALLAVHGEGYPIEARQSDRALTDDERQALTLAANIGAGQWNWDALAAWDVGTLTDWGMDSDTLKTWQSDVSNLGKMLEAEVETGDADAEPQIDRAAELNEKWQVKTGDLWRIGEHRLLCGDSTKREDVERVISGDFVLIADPPYGIDASEMTMGSHQSSLPKDARLSNVEKWDSKPVDVLPLVKAALYSCVWGAQYLALDFPVSDDWLCWDKKNPKLSFSEFELAWTNYGKRCRILSHHWGSERKQHITQKPLPVIEWCVSMCPDKQAQVLDPVAGSGTTLVACQNLQRKCRAIEISPNYCAVILERMATAFPDIVIERIE